MQRILASRVLTDSRWARRWTMNGFALSFRAKIRVKYDCGSLPKNRKKCFPCSGKLGEKRKEDSAMAYWIVNGKQLNDKEYKEFQRQQQEEQDRTRLRAEELVQKLGQTYDELTKLLEQNPEVGRQVTDTTVKHEEVYRRLKQRLELANATPRCRWVRQDGTTCGSPQMRQHIYCYAHRQMMEARALALRLPAPEDANAIQVGLMRIQKALIEDTISTKKAGLLLYSMQLALTNVGQTTFGQAKDEELVQDTVDEEEAFSNQQSAVSENQHQNQNQRPFTTEGTEDTERSKTLPLINADGTDKKGLLRKETFTTEGTEDTGGSKTLPLMNADERGLEHGRNQVQWKISPELYRVDTPEGMEAYEASFRMKILPALAGGRRPVQVVVVPDGKNPQPGAPLPQQANPGLVGDPGAVPHEHAQTHAILG
jgi:hypothetical protein